MDLKVIGKFIATERKTSGLTQSKLAEQLMVSEKTISKWECGKGFPDTTLMLPLCKALNITANELLSGRRLDDGEYKSVAEQNLIGLKASQQKNTKQLLNIEIVLGYMCTITFLILVFTASYFVTNTVARIVLICLGAINFAIGVFFCLQIEREAGYYKCSNCGYKYVPSYKAIMWSMHRGRTRYLKCPHCGRRSWSKKTLDND